MIYRQKPTKSKPIQSASKSKTNMKNLFRGFIFCALWYLSIIAGFFLLVCPILPLVLISPKRYRKWSDVIFGMWEPFPVAMMEVCFGIRVVLTGDKINPFEGSLFIMNHRTRVDWNFLWLGLFHCCQPNAHNMKYTLKVPIMHLPGPGWVMQTCSFIFLHRNWNKDKLLLDNILDYLNSSDSLYQILLFPEGTDLTENNIRKSHKYAEENNLEKYYKVLHPKTTGFAFIANKMKSGGQLKAVYDVTIAYPKTMPVSEFDLLRGKFPEEVHFNVKRYSSSNIPQEEEELKSWLNAVWKEKEGKLQKFYATGSFTNMNGEQGDALYNLTDQDIDFGKMSIKNGVIKYDLEEDPNAKEVSLVSVARADFPSVQSTKDTETVEPPLENEPPAESDPTTESEPPAESDMTTESEPLVQSEPLAESDPPTESEPPVESEPLAESDPPTESEPAEETKPEAPVEDVLAVQSPKKSGSNVKSTQSKKSATASTSSARPTVSKKSVKGSAQSEFPALVLTESQTYANDHISCDEVYKSENYRPSHLLYLVLVFWITLIILTVHQLFYNFYLQIWVLTHSLLFTALSFVSNGFHHVAACVYFYRYGRRPCIEKKLA